MLGPLLQYQSLKTVLLHTDANTRFRISCHMPSIRDVEKRVPLKMSSLDMSCDYTTVVNDTRYRVGMIRHFLDGNAPSPIARDIDLRDTLSDFDEFGFTFDAGNNVMLPGDVSFQLENRSEVRRDTEEDERKYRDELRIHEEALKMQAELKSKGITVEEYLKNQGPILGDRFGRAFGKEARMRYILEHSLERISYRVEYFKLSLLPFDCRRNNTKPFFIQFTITKGEVRQIHRFEYNKKLFEVCKYLKEALFGRRAMPIQVGRLVMDGWETIHRLPIGFRLHAKHVHTSLNNLAHASFLLIVENSERLETVVTRFSMRRDAFQCQIVRNARRLVIRKSFHDRPRLNEAIQDLPNLDITIEILLSPAAIFSLIQTWLSGDRPIGASCRIEVKNDEIAREVLKLVRTRYEKTKRIFRCVTIDQTNSPKVEVSYVPFTPPRSDRKKWLLKTRIVNA